MHYPKYLRYLDSFGAIAVVSAIVYVRLPDTDRPEPHLDGLWGNLTSEMIGIWLSVRLIDWIIRAHDSFTKARVRTVRFMRFTERQMHVLLDFERAHDLKMVFRELDWIQTRLPTRRRHLKEDENRDLDAFFQKLNEMLASLPDRTALLEMKEPHSLGIANKDNLRIKLSELEDLRRAAEQNILAETDEDDGI
jgi:hypothetical protein